MADLGPGVDSPILVSEPADGVERLLWRPSQHLQAAGEQESAWRLPDA